jgi:hypothetical protein
MTANTPVNESLIDAAAAAAWEADDFRKWWPDGFHSAPATVQERYRRLARTVIGVVERASQEGGEEPTGIQPDN